MSHPQLRRGVGAANLLFAGGVAAAALVGVGVDHAAGAAVVACGMAYIGVTALPVDVHDALSVQASQQET